MAGPWEAYGSVAGPWSAYGHAAASTVSPWVDAARSFGAKAVQGVAGIADQVAPMMLGEAQRFVKPALAAATLATGGRTTLGGILPDVRQAGQDLIGSFAPSGPGAVLHSVAMDGMRHAAAPADYQPQTTAGRYAGAVGENLPNAALGGEGIIPKVAAVVLPGVLGQGARDAAGALGAGPKTQAVAQFAGGLLGGAAAGLSGVRSAPPVIASSEQPVAQAVQAALNVGGSEPGAVDSALSRGILPVAADPGLTQLGETVATLPGKGQIAIRDAAAARMGTQSDRALGAVGDILGVDPESARGGIDQIVEQGQQAAKPLYDEIRAQPGPVWNDQLASLAKRPSIKKAINTAANGVLDAGGDPRALGMSPDPDTGAAGWILGDGEQHPTAETWDAVYKGIGQSVDRHPLTGAPLSNSVSANNANLDTARRDLRAAMVQAIPGYDKALATSGDYLSTSGAFNRVKGKLLSNAKGASVYDFTEMWGSLKSPAEQQAARAAMANDVLEASDKGKFEPGLFKTPGVQEKLTIAFGPDKAGQFLEQMASDTAERNAYGGILNNSPTARRTALIDQYRADNKPSGIVGGLLAKGTDLADLGMRLTHPGMWITGIAKAAAHAGQGGAKTSALPWEDPEINAQLGAVLSDPQAMQGLLGRMSSQQAQIAARQAARQRGLLQGAMYASPSVRGLLAP